MPPSKPISPEKQQVFEAALPVGTELHNGKTPYIIDKVLGAGGFGITYRVSAVIMADNVPIRTSFAVKEFFMKGGERAADGKTVRYTATMRQTAEECKNDFLVEARRLNHLSGKSRNIVRVNEAFEENNTAYYVMQYLDGGEISEHIERDGVMTEAQALAAIRPIAEAVAIIHREHLLHLDIKPDNIVLMTAADRSQYPVLIDFGIAKHFTSSGKPTSTHSAKGASDGYAPIEQYSSIDRFAPEIDVYALGATLFTLLTGKIPRKAFDITENDISAALPDTVSKRTRQAILGAMKKLSEYRTPNVQAFLNSLEEEYALPMGTVIQSPLVKYKITRLKEELTDYIVYHAVLHTDDEQKDNTNKSAETAAQPASEQNRQKSVTRVKGEKRNNVQQPSSPSEIEFLIYELFNRSRNKRSDDGTVENKSTHTQVNIQPIEGIKRAKRLISQTDESGLPLAEEFHANNTAYVAAMIIRKPPLSKRISRQLKHISKQMSGAMSAFAAGTAHFARKAAKPVFYSLVVIALGGGAYWGISALVTKLNEPKKETLPVVNSDSIISVNEPVGKDSLDVSASEDSIESDKESLEFPNLEKQTQTHTLVDNKKTENKEIKQAKKAEENTLKQGTTQNQTPSQKETQVSSPKTKPVQIPPKQQPVQPTQGPQPPQKPVQPKLEPKPHTQPTPPVNNPVSQPKPVNNGNNEVSNTESQGKSEYLKRLEKMKEDEYNRKVESLKK